MTPVDASLQQALIPLTAPPCPTGWNHLAVADWLGDAPLLPAAVLVAMRDNGHDSIVLTRRQNTLAQHAGQVAFPGGSADPCDVDMVDTALRETEEEIGLPRTAVTPLGFLDCLETISGFCITPVVARVDAAAPPLVPNAAEVAEVFEVPLAFFLEPTHLKRCIVDFGGRRRSAFEFRFDGYRIWGVTAAMLYNLRERVRRTWTRKCR